MPDLYNGSREMYGLVNNALRGMVLERHGDETWERIRQKSASECPSEFVTMATYEDKVTYDLVGAACAELGVESATFLHELGEYWIPYATKTSHGALLERGGRSLTECVQHLDSMHARIALSYPQTQASVLSRHRRLR